MKTCHVCYKEWPDDAEVCGKDRVPLILSAKAARLHFDPDSYYRTSGGIDRMESTLQSLEEVLEVTPTHAAAAKIKEQIERALPGVKARADDLFRSAEEKFAAGDLRGCLEILVSSPLWIRAKSASELRRRVRQSIAAGAKAYPDDKRRKALAERLSSEVFGYFMEGLGGIVWNEDLLEDLSEVLFLSPEDEWAQKMKADLERSFAEGCRESQEVFRRGKALIESGDFSGCLELLRRSEIFRLRRTEQQGLRQFAREKLF